MFEVVANSFIESSLNTNFDSYSPNSSPFTKKESSNSWIWVLIIFALVGWVWWLVKIINLKKSSPTLVVSKPIDIIKNSKELNSTE